MASSAKDIQLRELMDTVSQLKTMMADVALRTKRKIFSYKIQKPLLKRNLKKDA